jgi:CDP-paratose 2-epimerase
LIDCAAEPSVLAGTGDSPRSVLSNNLAGTLQCLDAAARRGAAFLFLSSSRVYPIEMLNSLPWEEEPTRFRWQPGTEVAGFSDQGIAEAFPLAGARSFYGASKLAAELVLQEYVYGKGMKAIIDRCGNIAGPWQMGKVDQGVVTLWVAHHYFGKPLRYTGFGGTGKQVRDLLHVEDLFDLIVRQMRLPRLWDGRVYNIGGGGERSVSLQELTEICREATGRRSDVAGAPETARTDVRIFVTDSRKARDDFGWSPARAPREIVVDIRAWIDSSRSLVEGVLARGKVA